MVHDLGQKIVRGDIAPGDFIPHEDELKSSYQVSRTVTREAIRSLAAKGLVASRPKSGTSVCDREKWNYLDIDVLSWSVKVDQTGAFFWQLTELRKAIEPMAAALVAERGDQSVLDEVQALAQAMEDHLNEPDRYTEADLAFHITILKGAQNPLFGPMINVIQYALSSSLKLTNNKASDNQTSVPIHKSIANAIASRQPEMARVAMLSHFTDLEKRLSAQVSR